MAHHLNLNIAMARQPHEGVTALRRFVLTLRNVRTGLATRQRAKFVMVTHGILAGQYTLQERGLDPGSRFAGTISLAGRDNGRDCAVSHQDLTGKAWLRCIAHVCASCASLHGSKHKRGRAGNQKQFTSRAELDTLACDAQPVL